MIVYINGHTIYSVRFKKFKFYVNYDSNTFLGNINIKSKYIKISKETDHSLLKKFKISNADEYTENLCYIKFLFKYSPILSKLIDNDELDDFEMVEVSNIYDEFLNPKYYVKFNKTDKKFFEVNSTDYKQMNNIDYNYINVEKELIDLLNKEVI